MKTIFQVPSQFWESDCLSSPNDEYRYWLSRKLPNARAAYESQEAAQRRLIFVMLNPSLARGEGVGDPTQRKCDGFTDRLGYAGYGIINLFARSTPYPVELFLFGEKGAIGPHNEEIRTRILKQAKAADWPVVCAWGSPSKLIASEMVYFHRAVERFASHAKALQVPLYALAVGQGGYPRHPLMLGYEGASLRPWSRA